MNGKLANEQRKAIEKLVQSSFSRKIAQQRETYNDTVARVTKEVKDELGISAMDEELKSHRQRIIELEIEKEKLGISKYNDAFILGSKIKDVIDEKTAKDKQAIRELELQMDKVISAIWTSEDISDIKPMVDGLTE